MSPGTKNLSLYKGDSFQLFFRVRTKVWDPVRGAMVNGPCRDLSGMKAVAQIKASTEGSSPVLASFECTIPDQEVEINRGCVLLALSPKQTEALSVSPMWPTGHLYYDVRLMDDNETPEFTKTYLKGTIAVEASVS